MPRGELGQVQACDSARHPRLVHPLAGLAGGRLLPALLTAALPLPHGSLPLLLWALPGGGMAAARGRRGANSSLPLPMPGAQDHVERRRLLLLLQ